NCGPASLAEVLHYWGIERTQGQLAFLRHGNPSGMSTNDVTDYVQGLGLREFIANQGNQDVIKALVANGFPVIVAQYVSASEPDDHFRPIEAYDDAGQYFLSSDPLLGTGYRISYQQFDQLWQHYDRNFMVIYPPGRQQALDGVLALTAFQGPSWMTPAS
ncbi:MAG TPA: C39 family peptidase, partial [Chloroflexota bacterium]|nr:C39 family peptidase [Chloroflexota bacterium]